MKKKVQLGEANTSAKQHGGAPGCRLSEPLTPKVRRELAGAALLAAIDRYLQIVIAERTTADEWVDQETTPLGRRAHLKAVRRGDLKAVKIGRRVLVRRSDLDAFFQRHQSLPPALDRAPNDERTPAEIAAAVLTNVGLRMRAS
jgi:excisionase family DNA binding protein